MEFDGFSNELESFVFRFGDGHTTGKIGDVRAHRRFALFKDDDVFDAVHQSFFNPACFQMLPRTSGNIYAQLARNRHGAGLTRMPELAITRSLLIVASLAVTLPMSCTRSPQRSLQKAIHSTAVAARELSSVQVCTFRWSARRISAQ